MFKYLFKLSYQSDGYFGYCSQPNLSTVEGDLKEAFSRFNYVSKFKCSSRTDRFVNCRKQICFFLSSQKIESKEFEEEIKQILPRKIKIFEISQVSEKSKLIVQKTYHYKISENNDNNSLQVFNFNLKKALEIIPLFIKSKIDFSSFTVKKHNSKNTFTEIDEINIRELQNKTYLFEVKGKKFLRFMVRNIVGVIIAYATNQIDISKVNDFFDFPELGKSHYKVLAYPLTLHDTKIIKIK